MSLPGHRFLLGRVLISVAMSLGLRVGGWERKGECVVRQGFSKWREELIFVYRDRVLFLPAQAWVWGLYCWTHRWWAVASFKAYSG